MQRSGDGKWGTRAGGVDRPSTILFAVLALAGFLLLATVLDAAWRSHGALPALAQQRELVGRLGLTDLALFTEARYTRHLSQADRHTPFQDHPLAFDHFPSGSLVPPPQRLRRP
jgi:hypothetical protein